jgi:hypothetical protein
MECITYFFEPHGNFRNLTHQMSTYNPKGEKEQEQKEMKQQLAILLKRKTRRTDFAYILNQQRTKVHLLRFDASN